MELLFDGMVAVSALLTASLAAIPFFKKTSVLPKCKFCVEVL